MTNRHEVVEILDDSSEASLPNDSKEGQGPTIMDAGMQQGEATDEDDPEEYTVEAIRAKRKNKNGKDEYFIKWEGFSESENTWEPLENLKCPELIARFNEQEKSKRRRRKSGMHASQQQPTKKTKRDTASQESVQGSDDTNIDDLFVEGNDDYDDENNDVDEDEDNEGNLSVTKTKNKVGRPPKASKEAPPDRVSLKGFDRGLQLERIIAASEGDDKKLYFFLKWQDCNELELVEADELEKHASYALCKWYRERLTWQLGGGDLPPK